MSAQRFTESFFRDAQDLGDSTVGNDSAEQRSASRLGDKDSATEVKIDDTYYHKIGSWNAAPQVQELEQPENSYSDATPPLDKKPKFESLAVLFEL